MNPYDQIVHIAEQYVGVEELDGNRGHIIDYWNTKANVPLGSAWCSSFVMFCVTGTDNQLSIKTDLRLSAHVLSMFNQSKNCWVGKPQKGFLICWQLGETLSGHVEIIKEVLPDGSLTCIGGNTTGAESVNREGRFVAENVRNPRAVGRLKFKGYLDPWKNAYKTMFLNELG